MDKNKILEYINNTPENTNPAIISSMLDGYSSAEKYTGKTTGLSEGSGDVTISYKGTVLGNLSDSGTAILKTKDTICEDDIEVEYAKPGGSQTVLIPVYMQKVNDEGPIGSPELLRTITETVGEYASSNDFFTNADIPRNWELVGKAWAQSESFSGNIRRLDIPYDEYSRVLVPSMPQTVTDVNDESNFITIDCFLFRIIAMGQ